MTKLPFSTSAAHWAVMKEVVQETVPWVHLIPTVCLSWGHYNMSLQREWLEKLSKLILPSFWRPEV